MIIHDVTAALAMGIEAAAAVVIVIATAVAIWRAAILIVRPSAALAGKERIRLRLGTWLSLAIEFELAADILRTAVTPTWDDLGKLAAIVVIRTVINVFLQRDIDAAARRGVKPTDESAAS